MLFRVKHKGMLRFTGRLEQAYDYLSRHWGTAARAYEVGVKLEPVF